MMNKLNRYTEQLPDENLHRRTTRSSIPIATVPSSTSLPMDTEQQTTSTE